MDRTYLERVFLIWSHEADSLKVVSGRATFFLGESLERCAASPLTIGSIASKSSALRCVEEVVWLTV